MAVTIRITTDRLPHRAKGSLHDVTEEKAASMVAQGFAVIETAAPAPAPARAPAPAAQDLTDAAADPERPAPRRRRIAEG